MLASSRLSRHAAPVQVVILVRRSARGWWVPQPGFRTALNVCLRVQTGVTTPASCASLTAFGNGVVNIALSGIKGVGIWSVVLWVPQLLAAFTASYIMYKGQFAPKSVEELHEDQVRTRE